MSKITDYLFEEYCVNYEDEKFCELMKEHDKEIRDKAIEEFAKALTDKIEAKYCRADLTSQYVGMQTCYWIKEIAEQMKEVGE